MARIARGRRPKTFELPYRCTAEGCRGIHVMEVMRDEETRIAKGGVFKCPKVNKSVRMNRLHISLRNAQMALSRMTIIGYAENP